MVVKGKVFQVKLLDPEDLECDSECGSECDSESESVESYKPTQKNCPQRKSGG